MANNINSKSLDKRMRAIFLGILIAAAVALVVLIVLLIVYFSLRNSAVLVALGIYALVFVAFIIIGSFLLIKFTNKHFILNILNVSKKNLSSVRNENNVLDRFPENQYAEYDEMNKVIDELVAHNRNITIVNAESDYSKIPLEFINAVKHVVSYDTFSKYLREIIYCSQAFRNVLISLNYSISSEEVITEEENDKIIDFINKVFDYEGVLISRKENEYFIYIPSIDSTKQLEDEIELLVSRTSIAKQRADGTAIIIGKVSAVIYPYSNIDEMFADLEYAKRKDDDITIYYPNKDNRDPNHSILQSTMNLNSINKTLTQIDALKIRNQDLSTDLKDIEKILVKLACYVNSDECGLILFNKALNCYVDSLMISIAGGEATSKVGNEKVDDRIISAFATSVDKNNVFYFSSRKRIGSKIGEISDLLGISSGFIYKIDGEDAPLGFVFFMNKNEKTFKIDSYLYESLVVVSSLIGSHIKQFFIVNQLKDYRQREEEALKLANLFSYSIDKESYEILDCSESFIDTFGKVKEKEVCYKKLYGRDEPCLHCPLRTGNKMVGNIKEGKYETSLYLAANDNAKVADLIMSELESNLDATSRYDKDYLVKSPYAFANRLKDLFYTNSKGYMLILMIDNASELVEKLGSEGYADFMRKFTKAVANNVENSTDIFLFKDDTLAILYPEMGKIDIITKIEKIYNLSKENFIGSDLKPEFKIAYDAVKYPQSFPSANDIINYVNRSIYNRNRTQFRSDLLHLDENNYFRQASRKEYIFSILDESVHSKTFNVKLQPMIRDFDKAITGAELLIRLSDAYKESMINTNELIQVAAENDKIGAISDFLMNYIADLYKKFGHNIFKTHGFTRLSLNTDYSYFTDIHFFDKVAALKKETYLPKDFLAFEINEREVYEHADKFKEIFEGIKRADVALVCDQYTGEFLSLEKLKEIGFSEVKIARSMVKDIEINEDKFNNVRMIIANAMAYDIKTCLVGIENKEQYTLVKNDQVNCHMQGYYFYKPLDILELMEAVRADNN